MLVIESRLQTTAAIGLVNRQLHRTSDGIRIENYCAMNIARGSADRLDEGAIGAQKALFVGVEDSNQGYFRQVEAFAEEVNSDQNIKNTHAQLSNNLDPLKGLDIRV